jgi:iron complex outermembrane receptor protein
LGNFLGASELDIQKVDLVVGASSAFYGPNAFNGVIAMETKNPFFNKGLAASVKVGERSLVETALQICRCDLKINQANLLLHTNSISPILTCQ